MELNFKLKEESGGDFTLIGLNRIVEYEEHIPKKKMVDKKFLQKKKDIILSEYNRYTELQNALKSIQFQSNAVDNPLHLLDSRKNPIRFYYEDETCLTIDVDFDYNRDLLVNIYLERYNNRLSFWCGILFYSIKVKRRTRLTKVVRKIEDALNKEWNILSGTGKINDVLKNSFYQHGISIQNAEKKERIEQLHWTHLLSRLEICDTEKAIAIGIRHRESCVVGKGGRIENRICLYDEKINNRQFLYSYHEITSIPFDGTLENALEVIPVMVNEIYEKEERKKSTIDYAYSVINK